ncbi:MAB_1171c family putative transporter [Streptomyces sp. NPDC007355]|uniref:MAB_1171c family putative transporter n=1 Tax=Streptomyces sp. NPDC007355 TaxID=3364778 RepID=UPI003697B6E6
MLDEQSYTASYSAVGILLYVLCAYKTRAWISERIPSLLLMAGASASAGTGFLSAAPSVYRKISEATGISNLATFIVYASITITCACYLMMVLLWSTSATASNALKRSTETDRLPFTLKRVVPAYGFALAAMAVLFFSTDLPAGEKPLSFDTSFTDDPKIVAFLMIYQVGYCVALWSMAFVMWRYTWRIKDRRLLTSVYPIAFGCTITGLYGPLKVIAIIGTMRGYEMEELSNVVAPACPTFGGTIIAAGWSYGGLRSRFRRYQEYRALKELWVTVTQADPGLILRTHVPRSDWGQTLTAVRRAGEIRDGQLALRPWTSQRIVDTARRIAEEEDLRPSEREALAAAASLRAALYALRNNEPPEIPCQILPGTDVAPHAERSHLMTVGKFLHTPLTDKVLAEAR